MAESIKSKMVRIRYGLMPCYRRTGVKVTYISADFHEARIELPLNRKTRGYNGTLFGGSLYGCIDPVYMTLLSLLLGRKYIVWDKAAIIEFKKPGRSTLYSTFVVPSGELDAIRKELESTDRTERIYDVQLTDANGVVHFTARKTVVVVNRKSV